MHHFVQPQKNLKIRKSAQYEGLYTKTKVYFAKLYL